MTGTRAMTDPHVLFETHLPLPGRRQGKVRDLYTIPAGKGHMNRVLIVATDRISAFDVVLPTAIPSKGCILNTISTHWFEFVRRLNVIGDHLLSTSAHDVPGLDEDDRSSISGRVMIGRPVDVIPIEFVARGYLAGSGWVEYQESGAVCGITLPRGLRQCDRLPDPIFTPATKAQIGHDENIDFDAAVVIAGGDTMARLREITLTIYAAASGYAAERGIIIADTKFEFGRVLDEEGHPTDETILIDEILTPDSSRFWPADEYAPGTSQKSFDKQYVRDYLLGLVRDGKWNKTSPGPTLPHTIIENTCARYDEACRRLFP